jgi:hypothetical protein
LDGLPFVAIVEPADLAPGHGPAGAERIDDASLGRVLAEREVPSTALSIESAGPKVYFMTGVPVDGPILVV